MGLVLLDPLPRRPNHSLTNMSFPVSLLFDTFFDQKLVLGLLGVALGPLEPLLGSSWDLLGRSWTLLGRSWGGLGPLLGRPGRLLGRPGAIQNRSKNRSET